MAGRRAVVVTGSYGAGHDVAARRIAGLLGAAGHRVEVLDVVEAYPWGTGRLLRRLYFAQLAVCPRTWGWVLALLSGNARFSGAIRWALARLPRRRLRAMLTGEVELVVSTHPFASAALAAMRRDAVLAAPVATYLTDPSVHALWVHRGVDIHLAGYTEADRQARAIGASRVRLVRPLVPPAPPLPTADRIDVLRRAGLGMEAPIALVVGGSEGVGELARSAVEIAATGLALPVVVCGHNRELLAEVARLPGVVGLPWQDDLGRLIAAADVVVQNAGGSTALEALAAGTPVVSYRCVPGHGVANAEAMATEGLAAWPRTPGGFVDALAEALAAPRGAPEAWAARAGLAEAMAEVLAPPPVLV